MNGLLIGVGVVVVFFIGLIVLSHYRTKHAKPVADHPNVKNLTQNNFKQYTSGGVVLVDFWAAWCGPCKIIGPVVNEIAEEQEGRLKVGKVNVDNQKELAAKFKIRSIPTLLLLKNGKEVKRIVGVKSKKALLAEIEGVLG